MKIGLFHLVLLAGAGLSLSLPLNAQISNRVVAPVDATKLVPLAGNVHPLAQARFDRGPAPVSNPTGRVMLVLQRSAAQQQALTQYLGDLQNPSSPNFHKWLTPAQYGAEYGISDSDLQTVESWLQTQGFTIEKVPQARNVIEFSGTFGQIQSAFHTSMHRLLVKGETHFANMSDPQIPAALAPVVAGVGPLNDFRPKPALIRGPKGSYDSSTHSIEVQPSLTFPIGSANTPYLFAVPADAATIYDTPNTKMNANYTSGTTWDGSGVNLGIVGVSDFMGIDISYYRTAFLGETTPNMPTVVVDGNDPGLIAGGAAVEALLDNEVSGGLAPGANVYFYASGDTDLSSGLFAAIIRAVDDNTVSILSMSFTGCEAGQGTSGNQFISEAAEQAAAQGITTVVAAGDAGSAGCDDFDTETEAVNGLAVNGLASTPYTIAVGGTDFDGLPESFTTYASSGGSSSAGSPPYYRTALKYIPEDPWNDSTSVDGEYNQNVAIVNAQGQTNIVGGGGGASILYTKPSYQTSLTPNDKARDLPDVSFLAADGGHQALWALCSDSTSDGNTTTAYTDCVNNNGIFSNGTGIAGVGGTSAAAPAFAGILAEVEQSLNGARLGQANYVLYQLAKSNPSIFHNVTTGNNSVVCEAGSPNCGANDFMLGYNAGPGYNLASGLGSIDVKALVNGWNGASLTGTTTALRINGSTAAYSGTHGANLQFSVKVTPTTASGSAAIIDTANERSSGGPLNNAQFAVPLTNGAGQASYNGLPGGSYTVSARYGGDTSNAASTSSPGISVTIAPEASTTTLQVNAYNPETLAAIPLTNMPYGSAIFADATITGTAEGANSEGLATGSVGFFDSRGHFADANVGSNSTASLSPYSSGYVAFVPGSYSLTASYSGDASYSPSTSGPAIGFSVVQAPTVTAAVASPTTIGSNGNTIVNITVTSPYNAGSAPDGAVNLSVGSTVLTGISGGSGATATIEQSGGAVYWVFSGSASIAASQLPVGADTLTATYCCDTNYAASSTTFAVTVSSTPVNPTITLTSSGNITVAAGVSTGNTSTITVTPGGGFTGSVNLTCAVTTSTSNPNDPPTCTVASPVTISGTTAATAALAVFTTATTTSSTTMPLEKFFLGGGAALALVFCFGVPAPRRAWRGLLALMAMVLVAGAMGCGGGGGGGGGTHTIPGTTPGTYTVTVTGKDAATGNITGSTTVSLTVTQPLP